MYDNVFDNLAINLHEVAVEKGFWPKDVDDIFIAKQCMICLLYTSPSPRDRQKSRMPSSA